jgi:hypothetical protein
MVYAKSFVKKDMLGDFRGNNCHKMFECLSKLVNFCERLHFAEI